MLDYAIDANLLDRQRHSSFAPEAAIDPQRFMTICQPNKRQHPYSRLPMPNQKILTSVIKKSKGSVASSMKQQTAPTVGRESQAAVELPASREKEHHGAINIHMTHEETRKHEDNKAGGSRSMSIDNPDLMCYLKESKHSVKSGESMVGHHERERSTTLQQGQTFGARVDTSEHLPVASIQEPLAVGKILV